MEKSATIQNLAKALCAFQSSVGRVKKDSANPFFKSSYASLSNILDAIQEPLAEAGLAVSQFPVGDSGLTTILMHSESGEYIMDTYVMKPVKSDPQSIGSAITYQRRYALGAVLSLNITDDDDANAASSPAKKVAPPKAVEEPALTTEQRNQILLLLSHSTITEDERSKMKPKVTTFTEERAAEVITKLKKTIKEREAIPA